MSAWRQSQLYLVVRGPGSDSLLADRAAATLLGLFAALALGGVTPEPSALVLATALIVTVAVLAALIPARRASRVEPMEALRQ